MRRLVGLAIVLFVLHEIEELVTGFALIDPWTQTLANLFELPPALVFGIIQLVGAAFLIWVLVTRPTTRWPYWLVTAALAFELDHIVRSLAIHGYYPGVLTAIPLVLLIVPFWRRLTSTTNQLG